MVSPTSVVYRKQQIRACLDATLSSEVTCIGATKAYVVRVILRERVTCERALLSLEGYTANSCLNSSGGASPVMPFYRPSKWKRNITNRWTGATAATFASSLVRRSCSVTPWPGQLRRWASISKIYAFVATNRSYPRLALWMHTRDERCSGTAVIAINRTYFCGVL